MATILITGGSSPLAQAIAAELRAAGTTVRLIDRPPTGSPNNANVTECALDAGEETAAVMAGVDQIVHVEPALWTDSVRFPADGVALLDACTRCTYNLLTAAAEHGVHRCVLLSSMGIYEQYATDIAVRPDFAPRPSSDPTQLAPALAEFGAREFALAGATRVHCARLGTVLASPPTLAEVLADGDALDLREAKEHLRLLERRLAKQHRWWITLDDAAEIISSLVIFQWFSNGFLLILSLLVTF